MPYFAACIVSCQGIEESGQMPVGTYIVGKW